MTHLTVLTNPTAGHAAAQAAEAAIAHLRARGLTVTHHAATSAAESHALAQEAARTGARPPARVPAESSPPAATVW
ncbi:hypothetical protein S7W_14890 [Mycobacteroides abscessus M94]|nr:hypothetical protein S7W_14890 [Mycobacteroides abscessus M94]